MHCYGDNDAGKKHSLGVITQTPATVNFCNFQSIFLLLFQLLFRLLDAFYFSCICSSNDVSVVPFDALRQIYSPYRWELLFWILRYYYSRCCFDYWTHFIFHAFVVRTTFRSFHSKFFFRDTVPIDGTFSFEFCVIITPGIVSTTEHILFFMHWLFERRFGFPFDALLQIYSSFR